MITSGKVETIQKKCSTFTKEKRSGSRVISADNTHEPGGECYLIAQEVESTVQGRTSSSTYTTEAGIRGMVVHM